MASKFSHPKVAERRFGIELRKVARIVGGMLRSHIDGHTIRDPRKMQEAMRSYAEALGPWAEKLTAEMIRSVSQTNKKAFEKATASLGANMRTMMEETAVGGVVKLLQHRQVELIKSLPIEAGERAQKLAQEAAMGGRRADEVAEELSRTEAVTESRATLIARTEIAKANAAITQARAEFVGATHYIWQTSEDGDVRDSHARMQGTIHRFDQPPTLEDGMTGNPGEFPNCRCFAEPIIPE